MNEINPADFAQMKQQVHEMYTALVGDRISNDGGLVRRIDVMEAKVNVIDRKGRTFGIYMKLLWTAAGGILMAMWALFIQKK